MNFTGHAFSLSCLEQSELNSSGLSLENERIVRVHFDLEGAPVNVFNQRVFDELHEVLDVLEADSDITGVVFSSGKSVFVAGAEIPALLNFGKNNDVNGIHAHVMSGQSAFARIESLNAPTVAAINGVALGGGLEFALAMDARVMSEQAKLGLPEVNLGLFPGYSGTARLPRMIDPVIAAQWISSGRPKSAQAAVDSGLVLKQCADDFLLDVAVQALIEVRAQMSTMRVAKTGPVLATDTQLDELQALSSGLMHKPGPHYPAARAAVDLIIQELVSNAEQASLAEAKGFAQILTSATAINLLSVFMNEQAVAKTAKKMAREAEASQNAAIIGAGIMGGGIAYQSALKGIDVVLKDIQAESLEMGMEEAQRNFTAQVLKGRMTEEQAQAAIKRIVPTLNDSGLDSVDLLVEAVVENTQIKQSVLRDLETKVPANSILTSNTSTISITRLAEGLQRPDQFCGLHFFNPVPAMPLVEVIRGAQSSDVTIARTVKYALQLGKNPLVVNDCPGFLVNRVLFPYIIAMQMMIDEGVDFRQIDSVMQAWGWPMGPAYLSDVIGLDTMVHCLDVMAADIPERMAPNYVSAIHTLHRNARLGQKNAEGFYHYAKNETGRQVRQDDEEALALIYMSKASEVPASEIEERLMIALCLEAIRCLEDGIVESPAHADMALLWGLGLPRFRGGALRYVDTRGVDAFCKMAERYRYLGPLYEIPALLEKMRDSGTSFYGQGLFATEKMQKRVLSCTTQRRVFGTCSSLFNSSNGFTGNLSMVPPIGSHFQLRR